MVDVWRQGWAAWYRLGAHYRPLLAVLLLVVALPVPAAAPSAELNSLLFVVSKETEIYRQVVVAGQNALPEGARSAILVADRSDPEALAATIAATDPQLLVTVGTAAAELVYQTIYAESAVAAPAVLSTLLTRSGYAAFAERYLGGPAAAAAARLSVQFLDQPHERQLALAALIVPTAKQIGMMVGPANPLTAERLAELDAALVASLAPVYLTSQDNPIRLLEPALANSDLFVPLADSRQLNMATSRWILQLSYRYRKPVVGYSASYVDAGAVAAVYTGIGDVAAQLSTTLANWSASGLPVSGSERDPTGFSIKLNRAAALALGIELNEEAHYRDALNSLSQGVQHDLGR